MKRPIDWQAREAARDTSHSCIVQAPAGSGKTELLTQRLLGLLAQVEDPEEIIAITFTRKAAAEMHNRLLEHLHQAEAGAGAADGNLPEHQLISLKLALAVLKNDATHGWDLLQQPGRLRILTIDSLCSSISRQLPVLSGLGGKHATTDEPSSLYREAATRTMSLIETKKHSLKSDITIILDRYDNKYDTIIKLVSAMLASREHWLGHILAARTADGFDRAGLETALRYLVESQLQQTKNQLPTELRTKLAGVYNYALSNQPTNKVALQQLLDASGGQDCGSLDLQDTADNLIHWHTLADTLLTNSGDWRKSVSAAAGFPAPSGAKGEEKVRRQYWKDRFKELLEAVSEDDLLRENLCLTRSLPQPEYEDQNWESLQSLLRILIHAASELTLLMAATGELDFTEVSARAIQALGAKDAPSDLALRLDYRIQHLLVDEFQDTSHSQIDLIHKLTAGWAEGDGRTLFLVGDPMQSIYRFRKAEVSLFIRAWSGDLFQHIQLQALELSVNFRSNKEVVDWLNQIFPQVMPNTSDPINAAVRYSPASTKPGVESNGGISCQILGQRDDAEEARQIIQLIDGIEPHKSIAILVRSRSHASAILAGLDKLKQQQPRFRYQAIDFTPLAETPLIQDLTSLTLAITQVADRLSWLAVLRAPFIGLALNDLDDLVDSDNKSTLLEALATRTQDLSKDAQQRLQRTLPLLETAVNRCGSYSVSTIIETCWTQLGGPACTTGSSELQDAKTYFKLLQNLETEGQPIDHDSLNQRMEKLFAQADNEATGLLQITTIHKAKGLQYEHVILPGLNRGTRSDNSKLLHWFELPESGRDSNEIVMSLMRNTTDKEKSKTSGDLIKFISDIEKKRQNFETGRLLYVAATRAIESLHLFAAINPTKTKPIQATAGSLLAQLWPAIGAQQQPLVKTLHEQLEEQQDKQEQTLAEPPKAQLFRRLAADWKLPPAPTPAINNKEHEMLETGENIQFNWAGQDARRVGELVHRLLERIGTIGINKWNQLGGFEPYTDWCAGRLTVEGIKGDQATRIIRLCQQAINNSINSDKGRWILEDHPQAACEFAITAVVNGSAKRMILDRTFVADGSRWIIDYKTSSHSGGDLEAFIQTEAKRYHQQLQAYKNAMSLTEKLPVRVALYFPLLDQFKEISI